MKEASNLGKNEEQVWTGGVVLDNRYLLGSLGMKDE